METELLTKTHLKILPMVADGLSDEEIARLRCRSLDTIKTQLKEIRARLGAKNRAHLVALAVRAGLLQLCLVLWLGALVPGGSQALRRPPTTRQPTPVRMVRAARAGGGRRWA